MKKLFILFFLLALNVGAANLNNSDGTIQKAFRVGNVTLNDTTASGAAAVNLDLQNLGQVSQAQVDSRFDSVWSQLNQKLFAYTAIYWLGNRDEATMNISEELNTKADATETAAALALKANSADTAAALALKQNQTKTQTLSTSGSVVGADVADVHVVASGTLTLTIPAAAKVNGRRIYVFASQAATTVTVSTAPESLLFMVSQAPAQTATVGAGSTKTFTYNNGRWYVN